MTEKDLQAVARASRDTARKESTEMLKAAVWNALPPAPVAQLPKRRLLPALATGAAGVTAIGVAVWSASLWLPGAPLAPVPAFAQVEKAMSEVQTAEWTEHTEGTFTSTYKGITRSDVPYPEITHVKVRLGREPRAVSVDVPTANNAGWRTVDDGREVFTSHITGLRYEYRRHASYNQFVVGKSATPAERIRSLVLFPRPETLSEEAPSEQERSPDLRDLTITRTAWKSHPDTLGGKSTLRWDSDWTYSYKRITRPQVRHVRIWVSPDTFRVLRREEEREDSSGQSSQHLTRVSENYRYNVPSGAETFAISPPPVGMPFGYRDDRDQSRAEVSITPREQEQIRTVVMQAARAWDKHDADAFARTWDFNFDRALSLVYHGERMTDAEVRDHERHWRTRAAKGIPYRRWAVEEVRFAGPGQSIYTRQSAADTFPPKAEPNVFAVTVSGQVQLQNGSRTPADATITLHKSADGMKITYINMYTHSQPWRHRSR